jgi:hypothetical protein
VFSVATVGGIFALSNSHHLAQLVGSGLAAQAAEDPAFMLAFQDAFRLGSSIVALATVVFWLGKSKQSS